MSDAAARHHADAHSEETGPTHEHGHEHGDMTVWLEPGPWDERYAEPVWSGRVNAVLATEAADLPPGTALDVGCGEGADSIWLAGRGWQVTGVDFSAVGLRRAAEHAREAGSGTAERLTWQQADVRRWSPRGMYDLVTSHFLHLRRPDMTALVGRLGAAVTPGGTLLVVGHHPRDLETRAGRPEAPDLMSTAEELADVLDPQQWDVVLAEARARSATDPDGREITLHDAVLRALRRT